MTHNMTQKEKTFLGKEIRELSESDILQKEDYEEIIYITQRACRRTLASVEDPEEVDQPNIVDNTLNAYACYIANTPGDQCERCPYGYGFIDDRGDNAFWWCDSEKISDDMYILLKRKRELIGEV